MLSGFFPWQSNASSGSVITFDPEMFTYDKLQEQFFILRLNYPNKSNNMHRAELLSTFMDNLIAYLDANHPDAGDNAKKHLLIAGFIFMLERIEAERWFYEGSELSQLILSALGVSSPSEIPDQIRLVYLMMLPEFKNSPQGEKQTIAGQPFGARLNDALTAVVNRLKPEIAKLEGALPDEEKITESMQGMLHDYQHDQPRVNTERIMHAALIQAIANSIERDPYTETLFAESHKIKAGILLFVMHSIEYGHYGTSLYNKSRLHKLCANALNIKKLSDFNPMLKDECWLALKNYLTGYDSMKLLRETCSTLIKNNPQLAAIQSLNINFNVELQSIKNQIDSLVSSFVHLSSLWHLSGATLALACGSAALVGTLGRGCGTTLGRFAADTNAMQQPVQYLGHAFNPLLKFFGGSAGGMLGNHTARMVVTDSLTAIGGAWMQMAFMAGGFAMGATTGTICLQVLPYVILSGCRVLAGQPKSERDPAFSERVDSDFVKALLALDDKIFSQAHKDKVKSIVRTAKWSTDGSGILQGEEDKSAAGCLNYAGKSLN